MCDTFFSIETLKRFSLLILTLPLQGHQLLPEMVDIFVHISWYGWQLFYWIRWQPSWHRWHSSWKVSKLQSFKVAPPFSKNFFVIFVKRQKMLYLCRCIYPLRLWSPLRKMEPLGGALHIEKALLTLCFWLFECRNLKLPIKDKCRCVVTGCTIYSP